MAHGARRLDLFVTEACNLACRYCFAANGGRAHVELPAALAAIDWLMQSRSSKVHITFWGGEPLLRLELLREITEYAQQCAKAANKSLTLSMPTNATLLSHEAVAWLSDNQVEIFLSIDGDATTQADRPLAGGGNSHRLAVEGMKRALATSGRRRPAVRMTITPGNAARQAENVAYFADRGVRELLMYPAMDRTWSDHALVEYREGQQALANLLIERVEGCVHPRVVPVLKPWRSILRRLQQGVPLKKREGPLPHCGAGSELVARAVDGRFYPCHRFVFYGRDDEAGRARANEGAAPPTLPLVATPNGRAGASEGPAGLAIGERIAALQIEELHGAVRCVDCDLFDLCTIGCVAINYATTGTLNRIAPAACALMRAQVGACRQVHEALNGDPRYALYLGESLSSTLEDAAHDLAGRAWHRYRQML